MVRIFATSSTVSGKLGRSRRATREGFWELER
jgi:hypothetical protein